MTPATLPVGRSVHSWVRWHAALTPDAPALMTPTMRLSYAELIGRAETLASDLGAKGTVRGDRVVVALANTPAMVALDLAIGMVGATSVPVARTWSPDAVASIARQARARYVALPDREIPRYGKALGELPIDGGWAVGPGRNVTVAQEVIGGRWTPVEVDGSIEPAPGLAPNVEGAAGDTALVMYTSGSTDEPKGVIQTVRNIDANTRSIVEFLHLTSEDRAMLSLPLSYCYGRSVLQTHFLVGGSVVLDDRFAFPRLVMEHMADTACTGFAGVPLTFEVLRRQVHVESMPFPALRYLTQAGGPMTGATTAWVRTSFAPAQLYVMYGQTEATARLSYLPPDRAFDKEGSIGVPIAGVELRVVDETGVGVPDSTVGHLLARGDNVSPGYLDDPEATASILRDGWLWTGDLALRDADGFFFHRGRSRDVLKVGGHRVSPAEIERVVSEYPDVGDVAVVGAPDPVLGEVPVAFIEATGGGALDLDDLRHYCAGRLSGPWMPRALTVVDSLPRGEAGKIRREVLARRAAASPSVTTDRSS